MELTVIDRLSLLNILPTEDSIESMLIVKDIKEKLNFSKEENDLFKEKYPEGQIPLESPEHNIEKDFSSSELAFLKDCIQKVSSAKKVKAEMLNSLLKVKSA